MASITKRSTTEPSQTPTTSKKYRRGANTEKNRTNIKPYSEKEEESHEEDSLPYISETEFPPTPELPRKLSLDSDSNSGKGTHKLCIFLIVNFVFVFFLFFFVFLKKEHLNFCCGGFQTRKARIPQFFLGCIFF